MVRVLTASARSEWTLDVAFSDGLTGSVSLKDRLFGPMFEPLLDPEAFAQVFVDEFGAVGWPNGADLAPDALHARVRAAAQSPVLASP